MYGEAVLRKEMEDTSQNLHGFEQALSNSERFSSLAFLFYGPFLLEYGFVFLIPFFSIHMVEEKEKRQKVSFSFYTLLLYVVKISICIIY